MPDTDYVIATEPLYVNGARAHNEGDQVPVGNVEPNGWGDKVTGPGTKAAQELTRPWSEHTVAELEAAAGERNLDATGKKSDLVERLQAADPRPS